MWGFASHWVNTLPSSVSHDTVDRFTPATLDGQPVLKATKGRDTIEVAATGSPYPVLLAESGRGRLTFSEWNAVPPLAPPPANEVITASNL